jgi:hypothetical protein
MPNEHVQQEQGHNRPERGPDVVPVQQIGEYTENDVYPTADAAYSKHYEPDGQKEYHYPLPFVRAFAAKSSMPH